MEELLVELLEPLALVVYAVLAAGLTVAGLAMEWVGLTGGSGSHFGVPTIWLVYMGVVALFAGYLIARDKVAPGLRAASAFRNP